MRKAIILGLLGVYLSTSGMMCALIAPTLLPTVVDEVAPDISNPTTLYDNSPLRLTFLKYPSEELSETPVTERAPVLYYSVGVGDEHRLYPLIVKSIVQKVFVGKGVFAEAIESNTPPPNSMYLAIHVYKKGHSPSASVAAAISKMTLTALPAYSGDSQVIIAYRFDPGHLEKKRVYRYPIGKKHLVWIALLPFFWVNLFTDSMEDALESTAYLFLTDIHQEGIF